VKQVKVETSNLVHSIVRDKSHPSDNKITTRGVVGVPPCSGAEFQKFGTLLNLEREKLVISNLVYG